MCVWGVAVTDAEIAKICKWVSRGATIYIGRDHAGRQKLKVLHGPFGIVASRFRCDERDLVKLKSLLSEQLPNVA